MDSIEQNDSEQEIERAEADAAEAEKKAQAAANADDHQDDDADANESADGQDEGDSPAPEDEEEKKSRSQRQRERRKAYIAELEQKAKDAQERLERLKKAHEGRAEPKESDFDDYNEYVAAKAVWRYGREDATHQTQAAEAEFKQVEEQRQREIVQAWNERVSEAQGRYADFEKVALGAHWQPSPAMVEIIQASDAGPDLAYHLGSNPAVATRIASLPPAAAAYELGRIEARLAAPRPRTQSAAPEPIKPVGGRASGEKSPDKMTYEEYKAWRAKGAR